MLGPDRRPGVSAGPTPANPLSPPSRRVAALQEGLRRAVEVPLVLAETVSRLWPVLQELALCANLACRSDLQVLERGALCGPLGHLCPS